MWPLTYSLAVGGGIEFSGIVLAVIDFSGIRGMGPFRPERKLESLPPIIISELLMGAGGSSGMREKRRHVPLDQP